MNDITYMTINPTLQECHAPTNIFDLIYWCRDYERRNRFPCDLKTRFLIGFYQINQGIKWKNTGINEYEAYAASALHLIMVAERLGLNPEKETDKIKLSDFEHLPLKYNALELLDALSTCAQHIIYSSRANKTKRKSRYDPNTLQYNLTQALIFLIGAIPRGKRQEAFEIASRIMTKELK